MSGMIYDIQQAKTDLVKELPRKIGLVTDVNIVMFSKWYPGYSISLLLPFDEFKGNYMQVATVYIPFWGQSVKSMIKALKYTQKRLESGQNKYNKDIYVVKTLKFEDEGL